jgi:general secretion pathway protein F
MDGLLAVDGGKLRIPLFGTLFLQQETARFARTLGTLVKSGVPLVQAAMSARTVVKNHHVAAGVDGAIEQVKAPRFIARSPTTPRSRRWRCA